MSNGLKFDRDGNMIAALGADYGGRMLIRTDMKTGKSYILTGLFEGKPYNALNDITIDEKGRIYFTDPRYLGHEPVMADGFAAYRVDPDGTVTRVATDCGKCNGILISPDQKRMYIVSNDNGWLEFQNLKEGEKTVQGRHLLQVYDAARGRQAEQPPRVQGLQQGPQSRLQRARTAWWRTPKATSRRRRCEHRPGVAVYSSRRQGARVHLHRQGAADQRRASAAATWPTFCT